MTRHEWLKGAESELINAGIESARLDSELILTHALGISRTSLHAHSDEALSPAMRSILEAMIGLRVIRVPLAYIIGHREFYGRLFKVTPSVLIPRPESEDIVTIAKELPASETIIDVGTGSGAIAVTLALELPDARVIACDTSLRALNVARKNAEAYQTDVEFYQSDLLDEVPESRTLTTVVANLPYVALNDDRSPETKYEPEEALFASHKGLELIYKLIGQCHERLGSGDYLLLESNPDQQAAIIDHALANGFLCEKTHRLVTVFKHA